MPEEIVVLGSLNIDLVVKAKRMPEPGETLAGEDFKIISGGKGANQAVAIARMGHKVTMVGRVGADRFGQSLQDSLSSAGVDTSCVLQDAQSPTGTALIVVDSAGENRILIVAGANGKVTESDVDAAATLISRAALLVMQMEIPAETVTYGLALAGEHNIPVLLNLAPAQPVSDGRFKDMSTDILQKVSYLVVNENEAHILSGVAIDGLAAAKRAASALLQRGANAVILTMGGQGVLLATQSIMEYVPPIDVEVIDTTAAGDAFIGGFVSSLIETGDLLESVRFANAVGALKVTKFGAQDSLPTRAEVVNFLSKHTPDGHSLEHP